MAAARVFVGVGEATLTPTSIAMLSDVFPPRRRALASGVYYLGIPLGVGLSLVISGLMGPDLGWRNCFFILGAVGVVMVIPVLMLKDPRRGQFERRDHDRGGNPGRSAAAPAGPGRCSARWPIP